MNGNKKSPSGFSKGLVCFECEVDLSDQRIRTQCRAFVRSFIQQQQQHMCICFFWLKLYVEVKAFILFKSVGEKWIKTKSPSGFPKGSCYFDAAVFSTKCELSLRGFRWHTTHFT